MFSKHANSGVPRKVFTLHVLFSLIAVISLLTGLTLMSESLRSQAFSKNCELKVNKSFSKIVVSKLCNGDKDLQSITEEIKQRQKFDFCAIVDSHGTFLTHSQPHLVGKSYVEPIGERKHSGELTEVHYADQDTKMRQYSLDINLNKAVYGEFKVGIVDNSSYKFLMRMLCELPAVLIVPILCVFLGGTYLRKSLEPTADILDQLKTVSGSVDLGVSQFAEVEPRSAAALGWNRLITEFNELSPQGNVVDQLTLAIKKFESENEVSLLETLPYGVAETDIQGRITMINQAMASLLGVQDDNVIGTKLDNHLELDETSPTYRQLFAKQSFNRAGDAELCRKTSSGDRILTMSRQPVRGSVSQTPTKQVWSARDITQLKLADRARDEFLDSATHEIRTPLANIKAYAETIALSDINDVEQQKEFCNIINSEATRLARLIDDLLDVSSLEAGSLVVQRQKIELDRLVEDVVSKVAPSLEAKNIELIEQYDGKIPEIVVDKEKFTTCLINLLGNAAKYTPEGGQVTFRVRTTDGNILIEVEDNGVGISKQDLPKIFNKFFRSEDQRVLDETGTGLGLAFTQEVVRLHGGQLTAKSQLNEGSVFTITLPME